MQAAYENPLWLMKAPCSVSDRGASWRPRRPLWPSRIDPLSLTSYFADVLLPLSLPVCCCLTGGRVPLAPGGEPITAGEAWQQAAGIRSERPYSLSHRKRASWRGRGRIGLQSPPPCDTLLGKVSNSNAPGPHTAPLAECSEQRHFSFSPLHPRHSCQAHRKFTIHKSYFYLCVCWCQHVCKCATHASAYGGQKVLDPLKLEVQRVVGSMWVLRAELGSSVRAASAPSTEPFLQPGVS